MARTRMLDRVVHFDERSRNYPIRELLATAAPRSYTWACKPHLNQGSEGACVGFAWAHELAARPVVVPNVDNTAALKVYHEAQTLDEWPGEDYDGTSVLAGAKAVQADGYMPEYRWAFSLDDLILAIGNHGPAVLGINWYNDMFNPSLMGWVKPTGGIAGGHAILARGVNIKKRYVTLRNSWGISWGCLGDCKISFDDLEFLLNDNGEACIPVQRTQPK